jgi:hypothetical protein
MADQEEKKAEPSAGASENKAEPAKAAPAADPKTADLDLKSMLQSKASGVVQPTPHRSEVPKTAPEAAPPQIQSGSLNEQIEQLKAELEAQKIAAAKTRDELEQTRMSVITDKQQRRLNMLRRSGVDESTLSDSELLGLAPTFDPDTTEGKTQCLEWLQGHQKLIEPKHRSQPSKMPTILERGAENQTVLGVFGGKEGLVKKIAQIVEGG